MYSSSSRFRRRSRSADYWPGFVDVLSTLLLVMIFLLVVYMLAQYFLQRTVSGQSEALNELRKLPPFWVAAPASLTNFRRVRPAWPRGVRN